MAEIYYKQQGETIYYTNEDIDDYSVVRFPLGSNWLARDRNVVIEYYNNDFILPQYCDNLFSGMTNTTFSSYVNTSACTTLNSMFSGCPNLTTLNIDTWYLNNVTDMSYFCSNCTSLTLFSLNSNSTSNVKNFGSFFENCSSLKYITLSWDISNATNFDLFMANCTSLISADLSNLYGMSVKSVGHFFRDCGSLTTVKMPKFDWSIIQYAQAFFRNCISLVELDLREVGPFRSMISMEDFFSNCTNLERVYVSNYPNWADSIDTSIYRNGEVLFRYSSKLPNYTDASNIDLTITRANNTEGYGYFSKYYQWVEHEVYLKENGEWHKMEVQF